MALENLSENIAEGGRAIIITSITMLIVVVATATMVFFYSLRSPDQVLVPNVVGKQLEVAILEMQAKELYPKIQLRYSEDGIPEGIILEQKPSPGSIVKAGRRIDIVISRGKAQDNAKDYRGQKFNAVAKQIKTITSLTKVEAPLYREIDAPAGTIIAQNERNTGKGLQQTLLDFVVASSKKAPRLPNFATGKSLKEIYSIIEQSELTLDFKLAQARGEKLSAKLVEQTVAVGVAKRCLVELTMPASNSEEQLYGIFSARVPDFPYPIKLNLSLISTTGEETFLLSFKHWGGAVSLPFYAPKGATLVLATQNAEMARQVVGKI